VNRLPSPLNMLLSRHTRRREFISLVSGAVAFAPLAAGAQQPDRVRRLGVMVSGATETDVEGQARVAALKLGLLERGWAEGRNLEIDYRWPGADAGRMRVYAAELVSLNPDVIFAAPSAALAEVQRATRTIPVVFVQVSDPVGAGFVASLAHPGGNVTGFALFEFAVGAKWLELLRQIAPSVTRVAVIYDPATPTATGYLPLIEAAGRSFGVDVFAHSVHSATEIESVITALVAAPNGGVIAIPSALITAQRNLIISLANRYKLPSAFAFRYYPVAGGLISYGVDNIDLYRRAATYVDRIPKGEKPGDLPVQEATKFQLVINLKTAKALGLTVPPALLAAADDVIE
jgi:putative tryptophan/tyrosine transport system substrate-binding protein